MHAGQVGSIKFSDHLYAAVAELADARDSKSREVYPHVGSTPTSGNLIEPGW